MTQTNKLKTWSIKQEYDDPAGKYDTRIGEMKAHSRSGALLIFKRLNDIPDDEPIPGKVTLELKHDPNK